MDVEATDSLKTRRSQGLAAINIAAVIFGTAALFGRIDASPVWIVAMRALFAAVALGILAIARHQVSFPGWHLMPKLVATSAILALHWVTFFASVQLAGVAIATLTFATFPLFTVLINAGVIRRSPSPVELLAGGAIVVAVGLLAGGEVTGSRALWGALLGLTSAATFAVFGIGSAGIGRQISPVMISLVQNSLVALMLAPFLGTGSPPSERSDWLWLIALGVVTTALMHQLYFYALRRLSPTTCSGFVALEPVYAIILAAIFFHDAITGWVIVSALMIVGASVLLLRLETGADLASVG